jgi:hypothetical protein
VKDAVARHTHTHTQHTRSAPQVKESARGCNTGVHISRADVLDVSWTPERRPNTPTTTHPKAPHLSLTLEHAWKVRQMMESVAQTPPKSWKTENGKRANI